MRGTWIAMAAGVLCAPLLVRADDELETLAPGSPAPVWTSLAGVDGKSHSLGDLKDAKIVVVAFMCNTCPYAESYEDRLNAFARAYASKGVELVAISVSLEEEDSLDALKKRSEAKGFTFAYLQDKSQAIGKAYGAKTTPHLFVLDAKRELAYVGAFDNARNPERVKNRYVEDAVEALLAGRRPDVPKTRAVGCSIRYD